MHFVIPSATPNLAAAASSVPTILVTDSHGSNAMNFFSKNNIEFHPGYSWKAFIWLM
ncbi:hypothetical protein L873DRAFT_1812561, partial [Choiromyces venosus 120613-1]